MDKNAIKKYAVWARRELISRVTQKAGQYGISEKEIIPADAENIFGKVLTAAEKKQRQELIAKINREGFTQVMEEAAYTWFNRFCALRFMEVNGYLPTHIRVFTNDEGGFKPQIITEAINLELDGLDMEKVYALKDANDDAALFKYLVIVQCNALSAILPGIFQKINDYTELLFPDNLLRDGSAIEQMVTLIPEADWQDQVQIIGWLYQYYNTEPKDTVFANLKKNIKISKENIPAATQLFTPDWIVRYMVENSLGRIFINSSQKSVISSQKLADSNEKERIEREKQIAESMGWKYYLPEAEQTQEVRAELAKLTTDNYPLTIIKCIDPCCGSGHILVYMFDVLMQIYESCGYSQRDAATLIVQNNLYGLDIDERAAQLAYFSVMMKARQYNRRFFTRGVQPHVYAIAESNDISNSAVQYFCAGRADLKAALQPILTAMHDAKEYGSILTVPQVDFELLYQHFDEVIDDINFNKDEVLSKLLPVVQCAELLARKYHVVCANPPYMGGSGMSGKLSDYVKKYYPDSKSDLFAVFIEHCSQMTAKNGYQAMITQHTWMFLSSFEKFRVKYYKRDISSLIHFGIKAFEEIGNDVVQTCAFVVQNSHFSNRQAVFIRLVDYKNYNLKQKEFYNKNNYYINKADNFLKIPSFPLAYWVSNNFIDAFERGVSVDTISDFTGSQNITANNDLYLRNFWEVNSNRIGKSRKWAFYAKGGDYRKWYGDVQLVVDTSPQAINFYKNNHTSNFLAEKYWFSEGITYSAVTSNGTGFRFYPAIGGFDKGGATICRIKYLYYVLALFNSKIASYIFKFLNPTINLQIKDVKSMPIIIDGSKRSSVESTSQISMELSRKDWDSFETSSDFRKNPLV